MNEAMRKYHVMNEAEERITPACVEDAKYVKTIQDEHGITYIWLLWCDTGEEYWVLEGEMDTQVYKRCGIYEEVAHAYSAFLTLVEGIAFATESKQRFEYE